MSIILNGTTGINTPDIEINGEPAFDVFSTTISGSNSVSDWVQSSNTDPWIATKTVSGILSTDMPVVDIDLSNVAFTDVADTQSDWSLVYRVNASADDEIKFYATDEPTKDLTVQIQVLR